ncbi:MAG: glycosyltransferase family 2 protein [Nitrospirota bacterium]
MNTQKLAPIVVIPARNEAETIASVVKQVINCGMPALVVDDQSEDTTGEIAKQAGATVIETRGQVGYGTAIIAGLQYAVSNDCSHVITIDGDGAHDASEIPRIFNHHISNSCHLTIGDRFVNINTEIPSTKKWANHFAAKLFNLVLDTDLKDVACGFRVLNRQFAESLLQTGDSLYPGFGFAYSMIAVAKQSFDFCSTPVSVRYDGTILHCTNSQEIIDMLTTLSKYSMPEKNVLKNISKIHGIIMHGEATTVLFDESQLCLLPVPHLKAYIFQLQNQVFLQQKAGSVVDFRLPLK